MSSARDAAGRAPDPERSLVARAAAGDDGAFTQLAQAYTERVFRQAWSTLHDRHLAAEVTQDVLVRLHRALPRFRRGSTLGTWLGCCFGGAGAPGQWRARRGPYLVAMPT